MPGVNSGAPVPSAARTLLDAIETSTVVGLRDGALVGLVVYTFAQVGAAVQIDDVATVMPAEFDAQARFTLRAAPGAGTDVRGPDLLDETQGGT